MSTPQPHSSPITPPVSYDVPIDPPVLAILAFTSKTPSPKFTTVSFIDDTGIRDVGGSEANGRDGRSFLRSEFLPV